MSLSLATEHGLCRPTEDEPPQQQQQDQNPWNWKVFSKRERINFSGGQISLLEKIFQRTSYPTQPIIKEISTQILLPEEKVSIWFKNRRAKEKKSKSKSPSQQTQQPSLPSVQLGHSLFPSVQKTQHLIAPSEHVQQNLSQQNNLEEGFKIFVETVKTEWAKQSRFSKSVSILKPQVLPFVKRSKKNEEAVVLDTSDEEVSVLSTTPTNVNPVKPFIYKPIQIMPQQNLITIPRFITFQTPPQLPGLNPTKSEETKTPVLLDQSDKDVSVIPKSSYKVQEGSLKMVFLGLLKVEDFFIQVNFPQK